MFNEVHNKMATTGSKKQPIYYNPKRLESLCSRIINLDKNLEHDLYHFGPYGKYGHEFIFEKVIKMIRRCANSRHLLKQKSFEKWFRGKVILTLMGVETAENLEDKIFCLNELIWKIQGFRKIFGMTREVLILLISLRLELKKLL